GCICSALIAIAKTVSQLIGQQPTGPVPQPITECCNNLVTAIQSVQAAVSLIGNSFGSPVDLSGVQSSIDALTTTVAGLGGSLARALGPIDNSITAGTDKIASAIANAPPTDVASIIDQLKLIVREGDVKQPIIDWLTQQGYLDPQLAQLTHGADWADIIF